jgi:hypothetical protein
LASSERAILHGKKKFSIVKGVDYKGEHNGKHVFEVVSGRYEVYVSEKP